MNHFHSSLILLMLVFFSLTSKPHRVNAAPGDTITVQTFTYNSPGSPKEGWFQFPGDSLQFEKILMYYTLKCDPSQSPACGEWDYLTYTRLFEHTGMFDSTLLSHPSFIAKGIAKDTVGLRNQPWYSYQPWWMYHLMVTDTSSYLADTIGQGNLTNTKALAAGSPDHRAQYLWRASELTNAGFSAGPLSGMWINVEAGTAYFNQLRISASQVTDSLLNPAMLHVQPMQEVFKSNVDISSNGWQYVRFHSPLQWDGQSNVLLNLSYKSSSGSGIQLAADSTVFSSGLIAGNTDYHLDFIDEDYLDAGDVDALDSTQQFTFQAWVKLDKHKTWTKLFSKAQNVQHRIGIEYGPASNNKSSLYLLCGNGSNAYGYTGQVFEMGEWYHITMVYDGTANANASRLKLYVNGQPMGMSYNSTIQAYTHANDAPLIITDKSKFSGNVDEVRFWSTALSTSEIQNNYHTTLNNTVANWNDLLIYYHMNNPHLTEVVDESGNSNHAIRSYPGYKSYDGKRIFGFESDYRRPQIIWEQATYVATKDSVLMLDSVASEKHMIVMYADSMNATTPTDTLYSYISGWQYLYGPNGSITDSIWQAADSTIIKTNWPYYDSPYEIVNRWEIGRFITPYGYGLDLGSGWTWVYDVTDYEPLLHDSVLLTSGNWQELHDLKFVFIEGTPAREVVDIKSIHSGTHKLDVMDSTMAPVSVNLHPQSQMWRLKTRVTGHRFSNPTNCAEFCSKQHYVKVNGVTHWDWQIIQECADNPLYPQGGTWIYDRAGWCPGAKGKTQNFELTPFVSGNSVTVDYDSEHDPYGEYVVETQLISYADANFSRDVAMDQIIAPNSWELQNRFNPVCSQPVVEIYNRGTDTLVSVDIYYGMPGDSVYHYNWTGKLPFMEKDRISLPPMDFNTAYAQNKKFFAMVKNPNGQQDEYKLNDSLYSRFELVPEFDVPLVMYFRTNNKPNENEWKIYDSQGSVVASQSSFASQTLYQDTLNFSPGCYEMVLTDSDNDGISWWANNDENNGFMRFRKLNGAYVKMIEGDFGKQIRYTFSYSNSLDVKEVEKELEIAVYPNPTSGRFNIRLNRLPEQTAMIKVFDSAGKKVYEKELDITESKMLQRINLTAVENGIYLLKVESGDQMFSEKIFIQHMATMPAE